jgi:S1-C subfamily serine protease
LRAGDIITAINNESLSATKAGEATKKLLYFMCGVEEGDVLDVEYLRDGKVGKVEIEPQAASMRFFSPDLHIAPHVASGIKNAFSFSWVGNVWADMELVELSEGLGKYFGTDSGLLVVSAPDSNALKLKDGDVIEKIDGREPASVRHAIRILNSYQSGEKLKLEIRRDKKRRTLDITMPDDRSSRLRQHPAPVRPAATPRAPRPTVRSEKA